MRTIFIRSNADIAANLAFFPVSSQHTCYHVNLEALGNGQIPIFTVHFARSAAKSITLYELRQFALGGMTSLHLLGSMFRIPVSHLRLRTFLSNPEGSSLTQELWLSPHRLLASEWERSVDLLS